MTYRIGRFDTTCKLQRRLRIEYFDVAFFEAHHTFRIAMIDREPA
jgi:hypothetical protein